jgi:putative transposase
LFERGVIVSYETIRRWCDKFGSGFAHRVKAARRKPGSTWHLDEVFVTLRGEPYLLWRAVDQHGAELDILLQTRRDKAAEKRFFKRVLAACPDAPRRLSPISCAVIRPRRPKFPNWLTSSTSSSKPARGSITVSKIAINPRVSASAGCVASAIPIARKHSSRASDRFASTSPSSDIYCVHHSIANSSPHALPHGIALLGLPKIRPISE